MRTLLLLLAASAAFAAGAPRWIPLSGGDAEVDGLPWFAENKGEWIRLPLRLEKVVRPPVWSLSKSPSGARIRFRTDSDNIALKVEYPSAPNMANMHAFGQTGVDLYADGVYIGSATADKEAAPGKVYEKNFSLGPKKRERDIVIYLSLYKPVKVLGVGIAADAKLAPPKPFAVARPVVFYGTSITQGGCASRPAMSYQAILSRMLDIDYVNLGFSGNGMGEPEMARAVAEIDAAAYVLDFSQNNKTVESVAQVYAPFIQTIREKHPDAPIVSVTPIYSAREAYGDTELEKMRAHIREVVSKRIAAGDRHIQLIEGTDLLGPAQGDGLVDGSHPNDLGFQWMAEGFAARLRKVLDIR